MGYVPSGSATMLALVSGVIGLVGLLVSVFLGMGVLKALVAYVAIANVSFVSLLFMSRRKGRVIGADR
ncbi:MAG TPA: hypothetical protein GXX18_20075 [Bacillales bacterium]|nr:hypothetical protein [Bacillales bacterium]